MTLEEDLQSLRAIPWCRKLIEDSDMVIAPFGSRTYKDDGEDALFSTTIKTDGTIKSAICLYKKAPPATRYVEEIHSLFTLGNMLDGISRVCHGGIIATLFDEVFGILFIVNSELGKAPGRGYSVTAYLNVSYVRPVVTPQSILVTARLTKVYGRKRYVAGEIKDSDGNVLAKSEALFVAPKETKL